MDRNLFRKKSGSGMDLVTTEYREERDELIYTSLTTVGYDRRMKYPSRIGKLHIQTHIN